MDIALNLLIGTLLAVASPDTQTALQRFDNARRALQSGQYRYAFDEFAELQKEPGFKLRTVNAMGECQIQWGSCRDALQTLDRVDAQALATTAAEIAEWHRVSAAANRHVGQYDQALVHLLSAVEQDPEHTQARYELGALYEMLGQYDDAIKTYQWFDDLVRVQRVFPSTPQDILYVGMGFYRYSVLTRNPNLADRTEHVLREFWQRACMTIDLTYWPARLAIADLLNDKYKYEEALEDYQAVLRLNPHCVDAHLGIGRIALEAWSFENVEQRIAVALDINPRSTDAYILLARLRMLERRYDDAALAANAALCINPDELEALSYLSAAQIRSGLYDAAQQTQQRIRQVNPRPAILHIVVGKQLSDARQFAEAKRHFEQAIDIDPSNPLPRNELGMMYMQWGNEDAARKVLDEAFEVDRFNVRTKNTLDLLDQLESFEHYQSENFDIHYHADKDPIIGEYFSEYLESIHDELLEDYGVELEDKTIIEVFPDHRAFGVRIHGKPWIHTVGACTGRVIAMDAPRRGVSGAYNFASVLRHEYTHTVTLAATNNRIPHWFTEGLAVYQEDRPKSWAWRQMLAEAIRRDELFSIDDIDWGFIRPRKPNDRQLAYAQSEWFCEFIVEHNGYDALNDMLKRYREGQVPSTVIPQVTGLSTQEFDDQFRLWAASQAEDWQLDLDPPADALVTPWMLWFYPDSTEALVSMAALLVERDELEQAYEYCGQVLQTDPTHVPALKLAAKICRSLAYRQPSRERAEEFFDEALRYYERLLTHHPAEPVAYEMLAQYALEQHDLPRAEQLAKQLRQRQPLNPASYRVLSGVYLQTGDDDAAMSVLLELARHEEHDADVPRQIATIYQKRGNYRAASWWYKQAIYVDPYDVATHTRYARLLDELAEHQEAVREYRMIARLEPEKARSFNDLAFAYLRAGRRDLAADAAARALELDPDSPVQQLLDR